MNDDRDAAEQPRATSLVECAAQHLELVQVLAADVDEDALRADRVGGDEAALDQAVRCEPHDVAVLERARLGLVGVDDEVHGPPGVLGEQRCLAAHRESRSSSPSQDRVRDLVDDRLRLQRSRLDERLVAAHGAVLVDAGEVVAVRPGHEELRCGHESPRRSPARPPGAAARDSGGRRRRRAPVRSRLRTRSSAA